jgi:hypothetical protein
MEQKMEPFAKGAPEVYFNKPYLRRQHVSARRRPARLQTSKVGNKNSTTRRLRVMARFWSWWYSWFPSPLGDKV